ncbi:MAG TPA: hypothetical protein VN228_08220 [Pyrinomonadaceae bacterium]|nr:hypothetical protein [Pyrinomonadaceae bacterium]
MRKRVRAAGAVSLCVALCVAVTLASSPPAPVGDLSVRGRVLINGSEVVSGAAFFPGSKFATEKGGRAEISMGSMGRVKCLEETAGAVSFGEGAVAGSLDAGIIHVSKPRGVAAEFSTGDGVVSAGRDGEAVFVVNVTGGNTVVRARKGSVVLRAGEVTKVVTEGHEAAAGTPQTTPRDDDDDDDELGGWFWFGVAGYTAMVTAAIIYVVTNDGDGQNVPGGPIVVDPSPSR